MSNQNSSYKTVPINAAYSFLANMICPSCHSLISCTSWISSIALGNLTKVSSLEYHALKMTCACLLVCPVVRQDQQGAIQSIFLYSTNFDRANPALARGHRNSIIMSSNKDIFFSLELICEQNRGVSSAWTSPVFKTRTQVTALGKLDSVLASH